MGELRIDDQCVVFFVLVSRDNSRDGHQSKSGRLAVNSSLSLEPLTSVAVSFMPKNPLRFSNKFHKLSLSLSLSLSLLLSSFIILGRDATVRNSFQWRETLWRILLRRIRPLSISLLSHDKFPIN